MAVNLCDPPPCMTSVETGIAELVAAGPRDLSTQRLRDDLHWMARQQRALEAMQARWLAELDRREVPAGEGATTWWVQENLCVTSNAAYAMVRVARQLEHLPLAAAAFRAGRIGSQHVSVICRAMEQIEKTCLEPSGAERELVRAAGEMDPYSLNRHFKQMRYRADQEAGVVAEEEQRRRRWLNLWQTAEDTYRIEGELDAENGVALRTAIRAIA